MATIRAVSEKRASQIMVFVLKTMVSAWTREYRQSFCVRFTYISIYKQSAEWLGRLVEKPVMLCCIVLTSFLWFFILFVEGMRGMLSNLGSHGSRWEMQWPMAIGGKRVTIETVAQRARALCPAAVDPNVTTQKSCLFKISKSSFLEINRSIQLNWWREAGNIFQHSPSRLGRRIILFNTALAGSWTQDLLALIPCGNCRMAEYFVILIWPV